MFFWYQLTLIVPDRELLCVCFQVIVYLRSVLTDNVDARSELQ